jgi:plasmid maintenance system killer protein
MEVQFRRKQLQKCYEDSDVATQKWGQTVSRKYIQRINVLLAAKEFNDLSSFESFNLHPLKGRRRGRYAITLHDRWRMELVRLEEKAVRIEEVNNHYGD